MLLPWVCSLAQGRMSRSLLRGSNVQAAHRFRPFGWVASPMELVNTRERKESRSLIVRQERAELPGPSWCALGWVAVG